MKAPEERNEEESVEDVLIACDFPTHPDEVYERAESTLPTVENVLDSAEGLTRKAAIVVTRHVFKAFPNVSLFHDDFLAEVGELQFEAYAEVVTTFGFVKLSAHTTYLAPDGHTELMVKGSYDWDFDDFSNNRWFLRTFLTDGHVVVASPHDEQEPHTTWVVPAKTLTESYVRHLRTVRSVCEARGVEPLYRPDFEHFRATLELLPGKVWQEHVLQNRFKGLALWVGAVVLFVVLPIGLILASLISA